MQDPKDQDVARIETVEDSVRELTHPRPPAAGESVNRRCSVRKGKKPIHHKIELIEKPKPPLVTDSERVLARVRQIADRKLGEPNRHFPARKSARTWSHSRVRSGASAASSSAVVRRRRSSSLGT